MREISANCPESATESLELECFEFDYSSVVSKSVVFKEEMSREYCRAI
jgi:hypothetical protein